MDLEGQTDRWKNTNLIWGGAMLKDVRMKVLTVVDVGGIQAIGPYV